MISRAGRSEHKSEIDWFSVLIAAFLGVSFFFHLVGLGSNRWAGTGLELKSQRIQRKEHFGLWRYCVDAVAVSYDSEICDDFVNVLYSDWLKATQSFMVLAFFSYLGSIGAVVLPLIPGVENDRLITLTTSAIIFATGLFQFVALVVFACYFQTYFDDKEPLWRGKNVGHIEWSFIVVCLSCISCLIGGAAVWFKPQGDTTSAHKQVPRGHSYRPNLV